MNGKGDTRRPSAVDAATVASNWARTFGRDRESGEALRERLKDWSRNVAELMTYEQVRPQVEATD